MKQISGKNFCKLLKKKNTMDSHNVMSVAVNFYQKTPLFLARQTSKCGWNCVSCVLYLVFQATAKSYGILNLSFILKNGVMLVEYKNVKSDNNMNRKWFHDKFFDLMIWYKSDNSIESFQISYNINTNHEHTLTWNNNGGFAHTKVDSGEDDLGFKKSPILLSDGIVPINTIIKEFQNRNQNIENNICKFVLEKLNNYSKER